MVSVNIMYRRGYSYAVSYRETAITLYPIGRPVKATVTLYPIGRPVRATITLYPIGRPVRATITLYPIGRPVKATITLYPIGRPVRAVELVSSHRALYMHVHYCSVIIS